MSERTITKTERLIDVSERVRSELTQFQAIAKQGEVAAPRGLSLRLPGRQLNATEYVDNGCRGGWTESYTTKIGNDPVRVTSVEKYRGTAPGLQLDVPGHNTKPASVSVGELGGMVFFEQEQPIDNSADVALKSHLSSRRFVTMPGGRKGSDWRQSIHVRAKSPLSQPVSTAQRSSYGDKKYKPLDGDFERIDTYYDDTLAQTMVQVVLNSEENRRHTATQWVPLDALEFYEVAEREDRALAAALYDAADALLQTRVKFPGHINDLLRETDTSVAYTLPVDIDTMRYGRAHKASFALGRIAADQTLATIFVPTIDPQGDIANPYLRASQVTVYDGQPWVIDDHSHLATPLLRPDFATKPGIWSTSVEQLITEPARAREQSVS